MKKGQSQKYDVVVVGGGGHVGLPLSIMLASKNLSVCVYDISKEAVSDVNNGVMPFWEPGAEVLLKKALQDGLIFATTDASVLGETENIIVIIGTPVDEHLNPDPSALPKALEASKEFMRDGQLLILRSTIFPGVTRQVEETLADWGLDIQVAFAPERIAEHNAVEELQSLPQIISSTTDSGFLRASKIFSHLTKDIVRLSQEEAELAKLFTNAWRYVKFAMANQFFMMANDRGLDYEKIRGAMSYKYPRASDVPGAGFAAGPCLFKDTMQLAAFSDNKFQLGHSAMLVNEGLPLYVVRRLEEIHDLKSMTVGILGMSFKAGSDDIRSSLSYKLKRVLEFRAKKVIYTDPMVTTKTDDRILDLDQVIDDSDILILATPHKEYRELKTNKSVIDIWGLTGNGVSF